MKVFILSSSVGGGHMSAAVAVRDFLQKNGIFAEVFDTYEIINPFLKKFVNNGYEFIVSKTPAFYRFVYEKTNNKNSSNVIAEINATLSRKILTSIREFNPDLIISTHPFSTEIVSKFKSNKKLNLPLICVITDYFPHRTWISSNVDAYVSAHESMNEEFFKLGVAKDKIFPIGIPVKEAFCENYSEDEKILMKRNLGLDETKPAVMLMAGSWGFGSDILEFYKRLNYCKTDFQIIIITGKNQKLFKNFSSCCKEFSKNLVIENPKEKINFEYHKSPTSLDKNLSNINKKNVFLIYYTDEIYKYMASANAIITKPGGLTSTEAINCELPIIIVNPVPGQEEKNSDFLIKNGIGFKPKNSHECADFIDEILTNKKKILDMKHNCQLCKKSDCLNNILNLSLDVCKKYTKN